MKFRMYEVTREALEEFTVVGSYLETPAFTLYTLAFAQESVLRSPDSVHIIYLTEPGDVIGSGIIPQMGAHLAGAEFFFHVIQLPGKGPSLGKLRKPDDMCDIYYMFVKCIEKVYDLKQYYLMGQGSGASVVAMTNEVIRKDIKAHCLGCYYISPSFLFKETFLKPPLCNLFAKTVDGFYLSKLVIELALDARNFLTARNLGKSPVVIVGCTPRLIDTNHPMTASQKGVKFLALEAEFDTKLFDTPEGIQFLIDSLTEIIEDSPGPTKHPDLKSFGSLYPSHRNSSFGGGPTPGALKRPSAMTSAGMGLASVSVQPPPRAGSWHPQTSYDDLISIDSGQMPSLLPRPIPPNQPAQGPPSRNMGQMPTNSSNYLSTAQSMLPSALMTAPNPSFLQQSPGFPNKVLRSGPGLPTRQLGQMDSVFDNLSRSSAGSAVLGTYNTVARGAPMGGSRQLLFNHRRSSNSFIPPLNSSPGSWARSSTSGFSGFEV